MDSDGDKFLAIFLDWNCQMCSNCSFLIWECLLESPQLWHVTTSIEDHWNGEPETVGSQTWLPIWEISDWYTPRAGYHTIHGKKLLHTNHGRSKTARATPGQQIQRYPTLGEERGCEELTSELCLCLSEARRTFPCWIRSRGTLLQFYIDVAKVPGNLNFREGQVSAIDLGLSMLC